MIDYHIKSSIKMYSERYKKQKEIMFYK